MDKRYQVFVSSTYADLKEERHKVTQTLMELDCIPAGMELFPATDQEQLDFIKRIIDDCDYYLLIIGGRYGSITEQGISYTEQEYDYAVSIGLHVIALLHDDPDSIPLGKSEKDPQLRAKLDSFRAKVSAHRLVKAWRTADQLPGLVSLSLSKAIKVFPAIGWVRANRASSEELLSEINDLRKANHSLQLKVNNLTIDRPVIVEDLAGLDEPFALFGKYYRSGNTTADWSSSLTWSEIFAAVSPYLDQRPSSNFASSIIGKAAFRASKSLGRFDSLDDQKFQTITVQLRALDLIRVDYIKTVQGGMGLFWSRTPRGEQLMYQLRAIRRSVQSSE